MKKLAALLAFAFVLISSPSFGQTPAFSVNKNGTNQTVTANTLTELTWGNVVFDTNSNFSSNTFMPTVAGQYLITASAFCVDATAGCSVWVYKNGSVAFKGFTGNATTSGGAILNTSAVVQMNGSTDYLQVYVSTTGTTIDGGAANTFFTGSILPSGTVNSGTQYQMGYYATTGAAISGDSNIKTDASNDFLITSGALGIGTTVPDASLSLSGQSAKTIDMVRETSASTSGNNLTI
jgi:hypothetical protein